MVKKVLDKTTEDSDLDKTISPHVPTLEMLGGKLDTDGEDEIEIKTKAGTWTWKKNP